YSSSTFSVPRSFSWKMSSRRRRSLVHLEKSQPKVFTRPPSSVPIHPSMSIIGLLGTVCDGHHDFGLFRKSRREHAEVPAQTGRTRSKPTVQVQMDTRGYENFKTMVPMAGHRRRPRRCPDASRITREWPY